MESQKEGEGVFSGIQVEILVSNVFWDRLGLESGQRVTGYSHYVWATIAPAYFTGGGDVPPAPIGYQYCCHQGSASMTEAGDICTTSADDWVH
ncbi:rCG65927 [Rattus norvegicus]|uniref:LRRG00123 n=2 Tax=Rattus norvegicus TaxID=10116 RepID=Q6QI85_RAT|nr:LRRGT00103 [Rattus norvegicus]AAS66214.1 LRRG00123 [Rattus norvegicus]EDM10093.1 rCG65927 [Rattus norvegicus]